MSNLLRAVVVGINEYKDARYRDEARLLFARSDAEAIANTLRASTEFHVEDIALLTNEQATNRAVRECLTRTFSIRSYDSNTITLFYFAGHGVYDPVTRRTSLCCYDVDFTDYDQGGIRLNDIYDLLASCSSECAIAIIDTCFSGGIVSNRVDFMSAAERAKQAIEALRGPDGKTMAILAACASDQRSRENKRLGHGFFTYQILRGWRDGEAKDIADGVVSLLGLTNFLTRTFDGDRQKPQISVRGSRPIALWRSHIESPSMATQIGTQSIPPVQEPLRSLPAVPEQYPVHSVSNVYIQATLPVAKGKAQAGLYEPQKRIALLLIIGLLTLLICGLSIFFTVHALIH